MNTITFGGVTSSTYDIYISGEGVWDAPEREAELISIPGRNGDFIQDKGKFQNITVTYPAFIVKDNNTNFKTQIDAFRNAMSAKVGYQNLTDSFHTNEYRMAAFIGGMEIEPLLYNDHAATFNIVFECMPQRFLISGENPVSMTSGDTITNPTLFDAKPMVEVEGYGEIDLNGYPITIDNVELGNVILRTPTTGKSLISFDGSLLNSSDTITLKKATIDNAVITSYNSGIQSGSLTAPTLQKSNADAGYYDLKDSSSPQAFRIDAELGDITFTYGTSGYVHVDRAVSLTLKDSTTDSFHVRFVVTYNGTNRIFFETFRTNETNKPVYANTEELTGYSTKSALGNPTYLDCDMGDCYKIVNDEYVSLNHVIDLGSDLPVLNPGANTITYDNTITSLKVVPRWWQI